MNEEPAWRIMVHKEAHPDMHALRDNHPGAFRDMMDGFKQLAKSQNIFDLCEEYHLDLCRSYPHGYDIGLLRFKRQRGKWRVVLSMVENGRREVATKHSRPAENRYLQVVFVDVRTKRTYSVGLAERVGAI